MEEEAKQRIADGINRYGHQEVCSFSGVIINSEESRMRDHKNGRNYKYVSCLIIPPATTASLLNAYVLRPLHVYLK